VEVFLAPGDHRSMARQIYEQLRDAVAGGRLAPGARLTPSRVLATELGISRTTVADAYGRLVAEGYASGRRGGGTVVAETPASLPIPEGAVAGVRPTPHAGAVKRYGTSFTTDARYDLSAGRIDPALFPLEAWRRCVRGSLIDRDGLSTYGDPGGSDRLRHVLAHWITQSRGVAARPEQIVVSQGATQAIDLLGRALLRPGDVAAVEEPGYPPAATILESQGIRVAGVRVDGSGLVVDELPARAKLIYVTPSHQYPLGCVLTRERRIALLHWAEENDAVIIEDDYDSEFRHGQRPLEPLHRLDQSGRVVYVGTFSKVLSPSLRMGFTVAPPSLVPTLLALRQAADFGPPKLIDAALTEFIAGGHLSRHLRRARRVYAERHEVLRREVLRQAPAEVTLLPAQAGLHVTLVAPNAPDDDELVARAQQCDLLLSTLRLTYRSSEPQPGIVLGFGALATADVSTAVGLLLDCLHAAPRRPRRHR
jgi:GntR family transcriptional regulator/MocR family aminotransferase